MDTWLYLYQIMKHLAPITTYYDGSGVLEHVLVLTGVVIVYK